MKLRLLFAAVDIGYRIENYSKFLLKKFSGALSIQSFVKYQPPNTHYKTDYTYVIDYYKTNRIVRSFVYVLFFLYSLIRYNAFYFLSGETILSNNLRRFELSVYKFFGKRIVFNFVGSDIRSENFLKWKAQHIVEYLNGVKSPPKSEEFQQRLISEATEFADSILVSTPDLLELVPQAKYFPVVYDIEALSAEMERAEKLPKDSDKVYILHSPSNTALKGTEIITAALENIKNKYPDKVEVVLPHKTKQYRLSHSVSRYELFQLINQADIVIDQLIIGWYGLQSIEALIAGKQTMCYIDKDLEKYLYADCPIINANALNLEQKIEECIANIKGKNISGKKEIVDWVKANHTLESNNETLIESILPAKFRAI